MSDLSSLLAPIRERAEDVTTAQNTRTDVGELDGAVYRSQSDAPRLLAALDAVLTLADYPDQTLVKPKGDKIFYVEAHRIRTAVTAALGEQA